MPSPTRYRKGKGWFLGISGEEARWYLQEILTDCSCSYTSEVFATDGVITYSLNSCGFRNFIEGCRRSAGHGFSNVSLKWWSILFQELFLQKFHCAYVNNIEYRPYNLIERRQWYELVGNYLYFHNSTYSTNNVQCMSLFLVNIPAYEKNLQMSTGCCDRLDLMWPEINIWQYVIAISGINI